MNLKWLWIIQRPWQKPDRQGGCIYCHGLQSAETRPSGRVHLLPPYSIGNSAPSLTIGFLHMVSVDHGDQACFWLPIRLPVEYVNRLEFSHHPTIPAMARL